MFRTGWVMAMVVTAGCGGDDMPKSVDAPVGPPTVIGALAAHGPWMEDFVWSAAAYRPCTGCEHLTVLQFFADHYQLGVYARTPGQAATANLACSARFNLVETAVAGFDPRDRTVVDLTIGTNDCGFTTVGPASTYVFEVVTRDTSGAPSYVAYWPGAGASPFPGYDYQGDGTKADPLRLCTTAFSTLCEPACNLNALPTGGCGLAQP